MIKIEVSINPDNQQHRDAVTNFMAALGKPSGSEATKEVAKPAPKKETPKTEVKTPDAEALTVAELETKIADIDDLKTLEALMVEEVDGKDRISAKQAIQSRIDEIQAEPDEPEEDEEEEEEETSSDITIEDVRLKLADKVQDHRDVIKKKLTELEAKNVTTLEEKHYADFVAFLDQLK